MKEKLKITKNICSDNSCTYNITMTRTFIDLEDFDKYDNIFNWKKHFPEIREFAKNHIEKDGFYRLNEHMDIESLIEYWEDRISYNLEIDESKFWLVYNSLFNFYKIDYKTALSTMQEYDKPLPDFMIRLNKLKLLLNSLENFYIKYKTKQTESKLRKKFTESVGRMHNETINGIYGVDVIDDLSEIFKNNKTSKNNKEELL